MVDDGMSNDATDDKKAKTEVRKNTPQEKKKKMRIPTWVSSKI